MTDEELLKMAAELAEWVTADPFVKQAIAKVLTTRGYPTLATMARADPEAFVELHDAMKTMRQELPWT